MGLFFYLRAAPRPRPAPLIPKSLREEPSPPVAKEHQAQEGEEAGHAA